MDKEVSEMFEEVSNTFGAAVGAFRLLAGWCLVLTVFVVVLVVEAFIR